MRRRLAAVALLAAVSLAAAAYATYGQVQPAAKAPPAATALPASSGDRVVPRPAEFAAAAAAGLVPADARSLLRVERPLRYGEFVWNERGVPQGELSVFVDLRTQIVSVFRAGHEVGSAVILYGADDYQTPLGLHRIRGKARNHQSRAYDAPMPFALWLTDDGVAIHASEVRGGRATHGCIGVPAEFAERLFGAARVGDPVRVVRSAGSSGTTAAG